MTDGTDREEPTDDAGASPKPRGLVCTRCELRHHPVIYTRRTAGGRLRRRRECRYCGRRITTNEKSLQ